MSNSFRAGELADAAGVSTDSLRFYERKGLLPSPPRTASNYRQYPRAALDRVLLIRRALGLGITVAELSQLLRVRDRGGAPCRNARALLAEKLEQLEERLKELQSLREALTNTLAEWDARLATTPPGVRAGLLEAVSSKPETRSKHVTSNGSARGLAGNLRARRGRRVP
jgi:DNA-binding transcriptional MerR regulator